MGLFYEREVVVGGGGDILYGPIRVVELIAMSIVGGVPPRPTPGPTPPGPGDPHPAFPIWGPPGFGPGAGFPDKPGYPTIPGLPEPPTPGGPPVTTVIKAVDPQPPVPEGVAPGSVQVTAWFGPNTLPTAPFWIPPYVSAAPPAPQA